MKTTRREALQGPIRLLFEVGTVAGMSDGQLLDRFLARRVDAEAAEIAFAALVERHGPMVLSVCRGRLGDEHDAQDAFQATFLILARKAGAIRNHDSAASWLQGVARRVASCARRAAAVRRAKERKAADGKADFVAEPDRSDLVPVILEEVGDLPEPDRTPLILCLLDGLTHEEAATRLGWPVGTVKTRVRRAKDRLRVRLIRRGLAPSLGAISAALATREASAMPATLVRATARAAMDFELGRNAALISASVAKLVELGLGSLIMTRLKIAGLVVASLGVLTAGAATGLARQDSKPQAKEKPAEARPEVKAEEAPKPVAVVAEVAEEDIDDQVEMAKIRLEVLDKKVEEARHNIGTFLGVVELVEDSLQQARMATAPENLKGLVEVDYPNVRLSEPFEVVKKRAEATLMDSLDHQRENLKQARAKYSELRHKLKREEGRFKELVARADRVAPAGSSLGPNSPGEDDQIEASRLDIELLGMEVDALKQKVTNGMHNCLSAKDQIQALTATRNPMIYGPGDGFGGGGGGIQPLTGQALEDAKKLGQKYLDDSQQSLEEARAAYLAKNRDLKREQRRLKDFEPQKKDPETRPAQSSTVPEPKKPADVEARISDVERKLDLILKALEKQGREPGKK